jgi:tetratricopeptide (TPR) repeat protein
MTATERAGRPLDADALAGLEDEHDFLVRSIDDLDREHEAGDLDDDDYRSLRAEYTARSEAVAAALGANRAEVDGAAAATPPRSRARVALIVLAVTGFAVLCGVAVAVAAGRDEGSPAAAPAPTRREQLAQCFSAGQNGQLLDATKCYGDVLESDPANAEALTYLGWFLYLAGQQNNEPNLTADAPGFLERAIAADPTYPDAHVFLAIIASRDGRPEDALAQLDELDALNPPAAVADLAAQLRAQIQTSTTVPTSAPAPPTSN